MCVVFGEYGNYCFLFFDITLNFLEKNIYVNLLTRCDDACVITPYLFIYIYFINMIFKLIHLIDYQCFKSHGMFDFAYKLQLHYNIHRLVFTIWTVKIIKMQIPLGS